MLSKLLWACTDAPLTKFCSALSANAFCLLFGATPQSVKQKPRPNGIAVVLSALASAGLGTGTAQDNGEWFSIQSLDQIGSRSGGDGLLDITIYSALGTENRVKVTRVLQIP
jgi:hypothetical protein